MMEFARYDADNRLDIIFLCTFGQDREQKHGQQERGEDVDGNVGFVAFNEPEHAFRYPGVQYDRVDAGEGFAAGCECANGGSGGMVEFPD